MLLRHCSRFAASRARFKVGNKIEMSRAMMPMTTSSSTSVNARGRRMKAPFLLRSANRDMHRSRGSLLRPGGILPHFARRASFFTRPRQGRAASQFLASPAPAGASADRPSAGTGRCGPSARRACLLRRSGRASSTRMRSAWRIVLRRWAMTKLVRPCIRRAEAATGSGVRSRCRGCWWLRRG